MHVVFRERQGLEESDTPVDLDQSPAELVVLSFSDSDLGAFAAGWHRGGGAGRMPSLRLANLAALKHPLSVDTYVEKTLGAARAVLVRLIGGVPYWRYGLDQLRDLAQRSGLALAVLPADGRDDPALDGYSTLPVSTLRRLRHLCDTGGAVAAQAALAQLALAAGLYAGPVRGAKALPLVGGWVPESGLCCPAVGAFGAVGGGLSAPRLGGAEPPPRGISPKKKVLVVFYRSYLAAADLGPVEALFGALRARGCEVMGLFAPSLKAPEAAGWMERWVRALEPAAIVNVTAFSGKGSGGVSPLDAGGVPVFQAALATSGRAAWAEAERGLSPADLAMHVVLPEVDGRISGGVVSFKEEQARDPALEFARVAHVAEGARVEALADRVSGWLGLQAGHGGQVALVLSTYPGKNWQIGHAVGLDALASARAMLEDLGHAAPEDLAGALQAGRLRFSLKDYGAALEGVPERLRADLRAAWGAAEEDPAVVDGAFEFAAIRVGEAVVALQPERGDVAAREDEYHDLARVPRHGYVAFYLWLRARARALVHIGAHGTLEWLPGKAVALSGECWPEALVGDLPVIYPFIVNDPGEAAQAKRRIGAVTIGHVPPPLRDSGTPERLARLEALLDEFSNADGLDPRRRDALQEDIRGEAQALGLEQDLGLEAGACAAEAITRIDRFVCDVKESQFGDGLHVFGRAPAAGGVFDAGPSAVAERRALATALAGRFVEAGPSGSPYRGRSDVLPTGRNLHTTDPRSVPTRAAYRQGKRLAEELVRRHLQEEGDWPRGVVVDLWGSATMRTAGEEFAMALALVGVTPVWDAGSERVSGIEVVPLTEMDRPRIDVTLRVSGLFRDVFPTLATLFAQAVRLLAARDEAVDFNPYVGREAARVYGPAPGSYGLGMGEALETYSEEAKRRAGEAWLTASAWALDGAKPVRDDQGIRDRVRQADAFVHLQDLAESDLLLASDYAAHEAGFAAAQAVTGGKAALWHVDNTDPDAVRVRALPEEIARVVQARAAHPGWIAGMQRHGFRGAAEIAATLDHMAAFAHLAGVVGDHLFDLYFDATLGDAAVEDFLRQENPQAHAAMWDRFRALQAAGLWESRRNSIRAALEAAE
ncbi:cobaltochelatase subunit CobN [Marinibacterium profundimaris]|uniref:Cobalamin biosynthesis protein CobN n=1 Tax=Marinibacterium profundimaris TaxID=1679460 RepID=A0A225NH83_9RHOB|nr:cobaltochelatase subunit CobN [Marinibacterium profundimaris]OWU72956.1 cobalamin biosynthesis protein CobN [Marinibacterium profundimaris]